MRKIVKIIILAAICSNLYSINVYKADFINKIVIGKGKNQLGYEEAHLPGWGDIRPMAFFCSKFGIYINDSANQRIQIYDYRLTYTGTINLKLNLAIDLYIDDNKSIFAEFGYFIKLNEKGELLYKIDKTNLPDLIKRYSNYFPYKQYVFYYKNDNTIGCYDEKGRDCNSETISKLLSEMRNENPCTLSNDPEIINNIYAYVDKNNFILMGNRLLRKDFYTYMNQYVDFLRTTLKTHTYKDSYKSEIADLTLYFVGFDKYDNSYWTSGFTWSMGGNDNVIVVISKYGEVLDYFQDPIGWHKSISPEGDIYFWDVKKDGVSFYKMTRRWGLDQKASDTTSSDTTKPQPVTFAAKATALTATSFIDYQNMYTPYRVFDGDPKTAWLEGAKGSGIDEAVTLSLDKEITVDEIRVMPGYFDPQWWKANNRIKKLVAVASDQAITFNFEDKMEEQAKKLDAPITFSKIKFTIKDVYRSTGDDDTALSEISFYSKGKKIEIDMSGIK